MKENSGLNPTRSYDGHYQEMDGQTPGLEYDLCSVDNLLRRPNA